VLGPDAIRIDGFSVVVYDTEQFMHVRRFCLIVLGALSNFLSQQHFYHWWGEIVLGSWRVYSSIFPTTSPPPLPPFPARFILPVRHCSQINNPSSTPITSSSSTATNGVTERV